MSTDAEGPDGSRSSDPAAAESFPAPPRTVTDDEDRTIRLRAGAESSAGSDSSLAKPDGSPAGRESADPTDEREALAAMYDAFGTADRAQGIPPANPGRRGRWLDRITGGATVVAWHGERAVGHGVLLDGDDGHELALFVRPGYRRAGIGSAVLRTLLGRGRAAGVERVWLSVQRTNRPAVHLYRKAGFRPDGAGDLGAALTMARPLR
ncbi:GNAT family N-acetyltransferase [Halorussus halobius]|uniref:GNAT family N-acetyltransferase n=1 Tax=Halorussus halobius TaxID=1710537 RepID=UPI0010929334|nr:GNAT family N-acetyltransferase [Halorussus halobius]